jgi:large subunit ribosomal protein L29
MRLQEMRELTRPELLQRQNELEEDRFNLTMRKSLKALDNPLRLRTIRREMARIQTVLREDEVGIRNLAQAKTTILGEVSADKKKKPAGSDK